MFWKPHQSMPLAVFPPAIMESGSRLKILPRPEQILGFLPTSDKSQRTTYTRVSRYESGRALTWLIHKLMKWIQNSPLLQDKCITGQVPREFLCIQWVEAFSKLEAQNEESSKGTLVSAHFPTLESLVRNCLR